MNRLVRGGVLLLVLFLAACASGPTLQNVQGTFPPVPQGKGRIFFYRRNVPTGMLYLPPVTFNGWKVGDARIGGVFYRDEPPGHYLVEVTFEKALSTELDLSAGETTYVQLELAPGPEPDQDLSLHNLTHMELTEMDRAQAQKDMAGLSFLGGY